MSQDNLYQPPKAQVADVTVDDDTELASRGSRLGGAIVDAIAISVILAPVFFATGYWRDVFNGIQPSFVRQLENAVLSFIVYLVLQGYLLHKTGQTIGKRVVGTRIVSIDENRILPLWKIIVMRQLPVGLVSVIPVIGPLANLVEILFIFRSDRRCIHDLIAGTKVVRANVAWKGQNDPAEPR